ncbi:Protein CBG17001 [Caenorhabditis briggsae]|uniref:Protein CBG17001 n=2 Tax=Caenorhabditis briggsae TaxID=6238 RepID=A8XQ86_CAEBR|nr:Protein CBG17001 [Caenorhabditis briggsae]ULT86950.1 hypothetical protein L3Y34_006592 [Caenorhabditis briggsae]CAP34812.1 Protein CBG17001 [Caenorhabditis briggsae]
MRFLNLILLGTILVAGAHGASLAVKPCTEADKQMTFSCARRLVDFSKKTRHIDIENDDELEKFHRGCEALSDCYEKINHCPDIQDNKESFDEMSTWCSLVKFVTQDMAECEKKVDKKKNLACYKGWSPFDNYVDMKNEKNVQDVCKNFFGNGNCLKKVITEACGTSDWEKLKNKLMSMTDKTKECDFKGII